MKEKSWKDYLVYSDEERKKAEEERYKQYEMKRREKKKSMLEGKDRVFFYFIGWQQSLKLHHYVAWQHRKYCSD